MSKLFTKARVFGSTTLAILALSGVLGSGAAAQSNFSLLKSNAALVVSDHASVALTQSVAPTIATNATAIGTSPVSGVASNGVSDSDKGAGSDSGAVTKQVTLDDLIDQQPDAADLEPELRCLASAIYFEARSESNAGQLAVARVIIARSRSGRFPSSYCAVVKQPQQFSFVHSGLLPTADEDSNPWHNAVAIARIADAGRWQSPVEGALFFHASTAAPHWRRQRIARIDHTIFYR